MLLLTGYMWKRSLYSYLLSPYYPHTANIKISLLLRFESFMYLRFSRLHKSLKNIKSLLYQEIIFQTEVKIIDQSSNLTPPNLIWYWSDHRRNIISSSHYLSITWSKETREKFPFSHQDEKRAQILQLRLIYWLILYTYVKDKKKIDLHFILANKLNIECLWGKVTVKCHHLFFFF